MLVSCPSCGKRISDRAPACPFCKAPAIASPPVESAPPAAPVVSAPAPPTAPEVSTPEPPPVLVVSTPEPLPVLVVSTPEPATDPVVSTPAPPPVPIVSTPAPAAVPVVGTPSPVTVRLPSPFIPPSAHVKPFPHEDDPTATLPPSPLSPALLAALARPPGRPAPVVEASRPSEEPPPSPQPDLNRAALEAAEQLNASRFEEALATVDRLLSTEPRNGEALHTRALALFKLGQKEEAARSIVNAIEASPDSVPFWFSKASMEHEEGKAKQACRSAMDLVEIAQHTETESPLVDQGRQMIAAFEATGAFPTARGYLGFLGLGCASMKAGRAEAALEFFDRAIDAASSNAGGFRWKGRALTQLGQMDEALILFEAALEVDPRDPDIHHDRGVAFAMLGDAGRAVEAFDAALALDPHHAPSLTERRKYAG